MLHSAEAMVRDYLRLAMGGGDDRGSIAIQLGLPRPALRNVAVELWASA